jgi:2'-5' RNA ligase
MHGIVSLLDPSHAAQVAAVWARLQDQLDLQGMDIPPFPHVSYHVAEQYEVVLVEPLVRAVATHTAPVEVVTTGLGIFTRGLQPVLYITVARHPGLSALQAALWPTLAACSAGIIEYYHPDQWVPHITLHHGNLSADALAEAVRFLSHWDLTWRLRLDNLTLLVGDGDTPQHHVQYQYPLTGTRETGQG